MLVLESKQSDGLTLVSFREENNEIYLSGLLAGDKIIEATTENDMRELARIF
jgi:hypothetical protein